MASLFALPDPDIFTESSEMVYLSEPLSARDGIVVIPVTTMHTVISMFSEMLHDQQWENLGNGEVFLDASCISQTHTILKRGVI